MALTSKQAFVLAKGYTDDSIRGIAGALAGKNCTIESCTKANGRTTVVFKWTADNGDVKRTTMVVEDGTPIYVWHSGDSYEYGDLVIYASCFYRCITPNDDEEFDDTKWNEIGSPDGNYDIVQNSELLPTIFTAADRKMYFSIEDGLFYLWNGEEWASQKTKWNDITGKPTFADVATSGSYNDLEDTPEIPSKTSNLTNDSNFVSDANYVHTDNNYDATAKGIVDGVSTALNGKVDKIENKSLSTNDYTDTDKAIVDSVTSSLANKVDKVEGKGLSTNDYDNTAKNIVDGVSTALDGKVDKVTGKGLSKNDYTDADKAIVDGISTALNTKVDKVQGKQLSTNDYTSEEKLKLASLENYDDTEITGRISDVESVIPSTATTSNKLVTSNDIPDVSNFITNTVDNLVNYYTKSQTYTQAEVDALISAIVSLDIQAVNTLPTEDISTTTIYLLPSADPQTHNAKDEYINIDGTTEGWELIGSTAIDLSNYVTTTDLATALADYTTTANLNTLLAAKQNVISDLATIRSGASAGATAYQKPSTGIPKTDLASAVQTSLGKADTAIQDISGKADKVSNATSGNLAGLDANGNITDSGKSISDIVPLSGGLTGQVLRKNSNTSGDVKWDYNLDIKKSISDPISHVSDGKLSFPDASITSNSGYTNIEFPTKADKVTSATNGNFAGLDSNGNLTDSGSKASDFASSTAGVPTGGTTGQVLKKKSGTNYDVEWAAESGSDSSAYHTDDTAETTLADGDYFPFYDTSATGKRKTLWSNIKSVLKTYFDSLYSAKTTSKGSATKGVYFDSNGAVQEMTYSVSKSVPSDAVFTDTKNTAGSTDSSSKLFLIGATSQAANPQTYSQDTAYVGTDGCLYSNSTKVLTSHQDISGKADKVSGATSGNLAGLDSNGNLTDSGSKASDFAASSQAVPSGGTTGQVLAKASGTDYDTEWVNASGGSGGHTILNGSGSAMNQRGKLQFDGLNVTDDSGNDKTVVTAPTPDYVDEQFNPSTTYSKGMTCIEGNVRYSYKNSTATSGHRPPDTTYWEVLSVATQITRETVLYTSPSITSWTEQAEYNRYLYSSIATATEIANIKKYTGINKLFLKGLIGSGNSLSSFIIPLYYDATISSSMYGGVGLGVQCEFDVQIYFPTNSLYVMLIGNDKGMYSSTTFSYQIVGIG